MPGNQLSMVSRNYALALANPFDGPLATIPDFPSVPSARARVYATGVAQTGTTGFGFVALDPRRLASNDLPAVYASDSTYAGTILTAAGAGVTSAIGNAPYSSADFTAGTNAIFGRIVAAGLRVKYSGTKLNQGGLMLGIQHPTHLSLLGLNYPQIRAYQCSRQYTVVEDSHVTVLYCPVLVNESQFTPSFGAGLITNVFTPMAVALQAAAGSTMSVAWEAYIVVEYNGPIVRNMRPSTADPSGFAAVQTTAQAYEMAPHNQSDRSFSSKFLKTVGEVASKTITGVASSVGKSAIEWLETESGSILTGVAAALL